MPTDDAYRKLHTRLQDARKRLQRGAALDGTVTLDLEDVQRVCEILDDANRALHAHLVTAERAEGMAR